MYVITNIDVKMTTVVDELQKVLSFLTNLKFNIDFCKYKYAFCVYLPLCMST